MCESDSSSDKDSEDIKTKNKPKEKPSPGAAPSLSRLQAQELISRHWVTNHQPDPIHTGTSSDLDSNNNVLDTADYSGDTDKYIVPTGIDIKPEPTVDNVPELENVNSHSIATCSTRNVVKPSRAKQKQKPTKNVKRPKIGSLQFLN